MNRRRQQATLLALGRHGFLSPDLPLREVHPLEQGLEAGVAAGGVETHFGLSELRTRHTPTLEMALTDGTFTLVAANGDEISGTYEGTVWYDAERADLAHGEATFVVRGGTGRFEHAPGRITATFLEVFDDPTWASAGATWTLQGTVSY